MSRYKDKNKIKKRKDQMSLLESRNSTTAIPIYSDLFKTQESDPLKAFMNKIDAFKNYLTYLHSKYHSLS